MEFLETALKETTQVNANLTELQQQRPEAIARDESLRNDRAPSNGSAGSDSSPQLSAPVPFGSPRVSGDSNNERFAVLFRDLAHISPVSKLINLGACPLWDRNMR